MNDTIPHEGASPAGASIGTAQETPKAARRVLSCAPEAIIPDPHMPQKIRTCTTEAELQMLHNTLKARGELQPEWLRIIEQTRAELQRKKGVRGR